MSLVALLERFRTMTPGTPTYFPTFSDALIGLMTIEPGRSAAVKVDTFPESTFPGYAMVPGSADLLAWDVDVEVGFSRGEVLEQTIVWPANTYIPLAIRTWAQIVVRVPPVAEGTYIFLNLDVRGAIGQLPEVVDFADIDLPPQIEKGGADARA
jgi:hypothetical protein